MQSASLNLPFQNAYKSGGAGTRLVFADKKYSDWCGLLDLMRSAFVRNTENIDPPSTVFDSTVADLRARAKHEHLLLVYEGHDLVGCLFMRVDGQELFLGRFAIRPDMQGMGLARRMIARAEQVAIQSNLSALALETRVELLGNQKKFATLGFEIVGGRAHSGFDRITTLKMRKAIPSPSLEFEG